MAGEVDDARHRPRGPAADPADRGGWGAARDGRVPDERERDGGEHGAGRVRRPRDLRVVRWIERRVNGRLRQREPTFWLVSAVEGATGWVLPLAAEELLAWAWQRWEIEVTHRACKAEFGVGEAQCWGKESALLAVQFQVWVVSLLLLSGYRAWGLGPGTVQPPGRWWAGSRRWSFGRLWQGLRQEVWGSEQFRRVFGGTATNWYEKEGWLLARQNALQGVRRA